MLDIDAEHEGRFAFCFGQRSGIMLSGEAIPLKDIINTHARSSHVLATSSFTASALTTVARLDGVKSPFFELTVTFDRSNRARTTVSLIVHNLLLCVPNVNQ